MIHMQRRSPTRGQHLPFGTRPQASCSTDAQGTRDFPAPSPAWVFAPDASLLASWDGSGRVTSEWPRVRPRELRCAEPRALRGLRPEPPAPRGARTPGTAGCWPRGYGFITLEPGLAGCLASPPQSAPRLHLAQPRRHASPGRSAYVVQLGRPRPVLVDFMTDDHTTAPAFSRWHAPGVHNYPYPR
jgi:hypothetical protein